MMTMIKRFGKIFFIIDALLIIACLIFQKYLWLLNIQVAFISSLIISITTFLSYQRSVNKRLDSDFDSIDTLEQRDKIDEIDDPYDLYSEDGVQEEKELSAHEIKTIIKEEKSRVSRNSFKNTLQSGTSFISIYRVVGYSLLILGFFALVNHNIFNPIAYLVGLFIVPLSSLMMKFFIKE